MTSCLTEDDLQTLLNGCVEETDGNALQRHLQTCEDCRARFEAERLFCNVRKAYQFTALESSCAGDTPGAKHLSRDQISVPGGPIEGYRILAEIHRGGQGVVYKALQIATNRIVALKILLRGAFATERQKRRFEREIDVVASLKHPHIVTVFDSGTSQNRNYFAMEYVEGLPLDEFIRCADENMTRRQRLLLFGKVCSAVGHAHQRGVIHRDLKPGNVIIDESCEPYVLDFGLAKLNDECGVTQESVFRTQQGEFLGTLAYASPEQTYGDPLLVDVRSDVYSLGVMLFEVLAGQRPYAVDPDLSRTLTTIRDEKPPKPSNLEPSIDHELDTIILKSLAKDPERRYQSAYHLGLDLRHYLAGEAIDAKRDSSWYVLRKAFRRYQFVLATAAMFLVVITTALIVSVRLWQQAVVDRNQAIDAGLVATRALAEAEHQKSVAESRSSMAVAARREAEFQAYAANIAAADAALRTHDVADAELRLNRAPQGNRDWEWYQLTDQLDRSVATFIGHQSYVEQVKLLPRMGWLLSVSWDGTLRIWDKASGSEIKRLDLGAPGWAIAVSPDQSLVAVSDWNRTLHVLDVDSLEWKFTIEGPVQRIPAVAFTPDGTQIIVSYRPYGANESEAANLICFIDVATRKVVKRLENRAWVSRIFCVESKQQFVTVDHLGTVFWDFETHRSVKELPGSILAFSKDGSKYAIQSPATSGQSSTNIIVEIRTTDNDEPVAELRGHSGEVFSADFSDTANQLVTGARDKTVIVWDAMSGEALQQLTGHRWTVTSVAFDSDSDRFYSASWDQTVKVWSASERHTLPSIDAHESAITDLKMHPGSDWVVSASHDGRTRFWDLPSKRLVKEIRAHEEPVQAIALTPDGSKLATASWDKTIKIWQIEDESLLFTLEGHTDLVQGVDFHPSGNWLASSSRDNSIRIWETETGSEVAVLLGHDDHVHKVVFDATGQFLASCGHESVRLWDFDKREQIASFPRRILQEDYSLAFDNSGQMLVAGMNSQNVGFWDLANYQLIESVPAHSDEIFTVCFNPSGTRMVTASIDTTVRVWDVEHRLPLNILQGFSGRVKRVVFSHDGSFLVGGMDNGEIIVWQGR